MESPEEAMGSNLSSSSTSTNSTADLSQIPSVVKGKRTKRPRSTLHPPPVAAVADTATSSTTTSYSATEEDEDMANCLILLARGPSPPRPPAAEKKFTSRRFAEAATTSAGKAGFYVYECKTCNKCFPSFQALGGHRASHKKPRLTLLPPGAEEGRAATASAAVVHEDDLQISMNSFMKPVVQVFPAGVRAAKIHECSICGSEFTSGQALGGHMRRHRPAPAPEVGQEGKKEKGFLSLDLNMPAPTSEEEGGLEFPGSAATVALTFAGKRPMVFSPAALVDCHY